MPGGAILSDIVKLNADQFSPFIREGNALVFFSASWCKPCDDMKPVFAALAEEFGALLGAGVVDSAVSPTVAGTFGIRAVPSLALFCSGQLRLVLSGPRSLDSARRAIIDALTALRRHA